MKDVSVLIEECYYECGDGCCHEWWCEATIDGELVTVRGEDGSYPMPLRFKDSEAVLYHILEQNGINVSVGYKYDDNV